MSMDIRGWVILVKSANGRWRIGWTELFSTKSDAMKFLLEHAWPQKTKVVRGVIAAVSA